MSNIKQLIKKGNVQGGYDKVYPKTYTDAVVEKGSGANLNDILRSYNMYYLPYTGDTMNTRLQIPKVLRKPGLWITYVNYGNIITNEYYIGQSIEDDSWILDKNWVDSVAVIQGEVSGTLPEGGKVGQYLRRTSVGAEWADLDIEGIGTLYRVKGSKQTIDEVLAESENASVGDVWNIEEKFSLNSKSYPAGTNIVCIKTWKESTVPEDNWDPLGGSIDVDDIATYNPNHSLLDMDVTMPSAHGGLSKKKVSELKGKSYSELFDAILFPDMQPSVTAPSASISFVGYSGTLKEVGEAAPKESNFRGSFNRGSTSYDGPRAGEQILDESWVYVGTSISNKTFPETVPLGSISYRYHASYEAGPVVHTSQGNVASIRPNPLPAGSVESGAISVSGTYPYYCNGASASTSGQESSFPSVPQPDTKLPLVSWSTSTIGCKFASEATTGTRLIFQFPAAKTVNSVQFYNTVSGKWETFGSSNYTISDDANKTIQGKEVAYKKLTTVGNLQGALQLKFNLSNV